MGAGNSTAASCSSLDMVNGRTAHKHRYLKRQDRHHLHEHKLDRYRKQLDSSNYLKQASSHLDLASSHLVRDNEEENLHSNDNNQLHYGFSNPAGQAYNLTNADVSCPVMVLPTKHRHESSPTVICHMAGVAKKSNAGVASRILHQRQQQRSNELRKFSDSLPSLNNISCRQQRGAEMDFAVNERLHQHHHQHRHQVQPPMRNLNPARVYREQCSPSQAKQQQRPLLARDRTSAKRYKQAKQQLTTASKQQVSNTILVRPNELDNLCHSQHWQTQSSFIDDDQSVMNGQQKFDWQANKQHQQRQMKRATSLSSLHNLNQNHQQHRGRPHANQHRQHEMIIPTPFSQSINLNGQSSVVGLQHNHNEVRGPASLVSRKPLKQSGVNHRPNQPLANSDLCDFNLTVMEHESGSKLYKLPPKTPQLHRHQPSNHAQISAIMSRKNHKYKQAANVNNQALKSNRYKSKLQQQQATHQQGHPILPQLPRSQSLHELIQLRATENGQRMRTTGTLRGPLNGSEQAGKVNLVAELLETRRQQRQNQDDDVKAFQVSTDNSETLLSQSSSTDDGIHDVSINGDGQHSTGDSRTKQFSSSSSSNNHRSSVSSQECDKRTTPARQRIFKKQPVAVSQTNRFAYKNTFEQIKRDSCEHEVEGQPILKQQHQAHKSTLKRSTSYSALQSSNRNDEQDGDESDDLNELAKFLYQFKQRQVKTANASTTAGHLTRSGENLDPNTTFNGQKSSMHLNRTANENLQQSPNSTTSSSGFASSTCTSSSISFANGGGNGSTGSECTKFESVSSSSSHKIHKDTPKQKTSSHKKYPAPPKPDHKEQPVESTAPELNTKSKSCLISSKLKLSSSLLSIVDEYHSTLELENNNRLLSKNAIASSSSNLTSILLNGDKSVNSDRKFCAPLSQYSKQNAKDQPVELDDEQAEQFEHLRKYTKLRQMSQSELALNHLTSSTMLDVEDQQHYLVESNCKHSQQNISSENKSNNKPYTKRLFNLIRRISERSDGLGASRASHENDAVMQPIGRNSSQGWHGVRLVDGSNNPAGGQSPAGLASETCQMNRSSTINQVGMEANHSPRKLGNQEHAGQAASKLAGNVSNCVAIRSHNSGSYSKLSLESPTEGIDERTGENLRDLNFDCDFELIKNCGSANELENARQASNFAKTSCARQDTAVKQSSLFTRASSSITINNEPGERKAGLGEHLPAGERRRMQNEAANKAIANPSRENNWRLAPSSSLIGLTNSCSVIGDTRGRDLSRLRQGFHPNHHHHQHEGNNHNNKKSKLDDRTRNASEGLAPGYCGAGLRDESEMTPECKRQQQKQAAKSKWSASAWLLGGSGSGEKKKGSADSKKPKSGLDGRTNSGSRNYLARLIPNSGTPTSGSGTKSKQQECDIADQQRRCDMMSEADKLLVELDHSLGLVNGHIIEQRPWWRQVPNELDDESNGRTGMLNEGVCISRTSNGGWLDGNDDDENDNDDADYASISRAMINETFDVDPQILAKTNGLGTSLTIEPLDSLSDSFTFSAPSSPVPELRVKPASCMNQHSELTSGCLELVHKRSSFDGNPDAPNKQLDDGEGQQSCNRGTHSCSLALLKPSNLSECNEQQHQSAKTSATTTFTSGVSGHMGDVTTRKEDNGNRVVDNGKDNNGTHNFGAKHMKEPLKELRQYEAARDSGGICPTNKVAEVNSCKLELNDNNKIGALGEALASATPTSTYKKIHTRNFQPAGVQATKGHIEGYKNGHTNWNSPGHELSGDACARPNTAHHHGEPHDCVKFEPAYNDVAGQTGANDCVPSDFCHHGNLISRPNNTTKQPTMNVDCTKISTSVSNLGDGSSSRNKLDHNVKLDRRLLSDENKKEVNCVVDGQLCDCSDGCLDTGVKCNCKRGLGEIKAGLQEGVGTKQVEPIDHSVCPIHGQSICCCACCCTRSSGSNIGKAQTTSDDFSLKQHSHRQHQLGRDNDNMKRSFCANAAKSLKIEFGSQVEAATHGPASKLDETEACNCKLAATVTTVTRASVNMATQEKNERSCSIRERSSQGNSDCSKNCLTGEPGPRKVSGCLANEQVGFRCDHRTSLVSEQDDKLIIQRKSCHCCSNCLPIDDGHLSNGAGSGEKITATRTATSQLSVVCSISPKCTAGATDKGCKPALTNRDIPSGIPSASGRQSPKVTHYHYSHKMGNFAPTTTNGYHHHHRSTDAPGKRESQSTGDSVCKNGSHQNSPHAVGTPAAQSHHMRCACYETEDNNNDIPAPSVCSEPSPCMMTGHSSRLNLPNQTCLNEDARNLCCPHADRTGKNYALVDDYLDAENKKLDHHKPMAGVSRKVDKKISIPSNESTRCHGSSCRAVQSEFGVSNAGGMTQPNGISSARAIGVQVACKCLDRIKSHKCDSVNNRSTTGCNHIEQTKHELSPVAAKSSPAGCGNLGRHLDHLEVRVVDSVSAGKSRDSVLNQKVCNSSNAKHSDSSQVSRENYYGPGLQSALQSLLLPSGGEFGHKSGHKLSATTNDFDENFILKRKTPNAGLKSRC